MSDPAGDTSADLIRRAIADPGAIVERLGSTETIPEWQTRAVLASALPKILAAVRDRLVAETADQVTAVAQETVLEAVAVSTQRIAALEAALAGVLPRFVKTPDGWRARISGTDLDRLKATADGRQPGD